jgi:hypothetical protein
MQKLKLTNFKAHKDLEIPFDKKNFLLYGDNGAGKSSIYEALKLVFYKDRFEKAINEQFKQSPDEEKTAKIEEFYREFDNKTKPIGAFTIDLNDTTLSDFDNEPYHAYMLSLEDIAFDNFLHFDKLLQKKFFHSTALEKIFANNNVERFKRDILWGDMQGEIQEEANAFLKYCLEDITIEIDPSDNYAIKLEDTARGLKTKEIKKNFNEGKINLVILALFFSTIKVTKNDSKKNVLILDDFITSLDMSNRTFLMRYILETFKDFQIVILTHNVYFYNLITYLINDKICQTTKEWQFANLYEIENEHKIYIKDNKDTVDELKKLYKPSEPTFIISEYGNQLRQKFERLVYEFSKILMVGGVEESNKILEGITNNKIYFNYTNKKDSSDLIEGIEQIIQTTGTKEAIVGQINTQINNYRVIPLEEIKNVLKTLKLYRKTTMHSLSHGQTGQHNWNDKEIKQTLILLKKLETNIKDLTGNSVN